MLTAATLTLDEAELFKITGYRQPARQLEELRRQGFWRARRIRTGEVVLERAHYDAVCAGRNKPAEEPKLRPPKLRTA